MQRAVVLFLAFGFGSCLLAAQTAGSATSGMEHAGQTIVVRQLPPPDTCPVSLTARQSSAAFARQVRGSEPPANGDLIIKDVAQKLHLSAIGPDSKRVVAASLIVRGFSNKSRVMRVLSTDTDYDAAKILNVRFSQDSDKKDSADVSVPGLSAVGAIDLNSVTYADGSTWKVAGNHSCRAWIDGLLLVSGR